MIWLDIEILLSIVIFPPSKRSSCSSKKERQDIEDLEVPETKRLFLQQNSFENQKSKEEKEYLDAINKEVTKWTKSHLNKIVVT